MQKQTPADKRQHTITLENRSVMNLTGVEEVVNFSDMRIELTTSYGGLDIKGKGLTMSRLDTSSGELSISGDIHSAAYTNIKKKTNLLEGLFK
ncbi:MAG: YabP/YqfC family sporulation protein [Clostridia bacterium]|nr:YabP/YqfC family sporulation protein [Clostridia bacterium]